MDKAFEQQSRMMEQAFDQWRKASEAGMAIHPKDAGALTDAFSGWMKTLTDSYETGFDAWNELAEKHREALFSAFRFSPFFDRNAEDQLRETYAGLAQVQKSYLDMVKKGLEALKKTETDQPGAA